MDEVSVADNLSSILFSPHNVAYLGLLQPNMVMQDMIEGKVKKFFLSVEYKHLIYNGTSQMKHKNAFLIRLLH